MQKPTNETVKQPRIETERLVLDAFTEADLSDILGYASHPEVTKFVPWEPHGNIEDSRQFFEFTRSAASSERGNLFFVFAIRLKPRLKAIGSIDFKNPKPFCGQTDYALGREHWGKGIASEAGVAIRDWAFSSFPELMRFQAYCIAENRASSRVMEKIGMTREGLRRKAYLHKGQLVDLLDYAMIRAEV